MTFTDLVFNYGISIFILITVLVTGLIFYKIGYLYGHQAGWKEGTIRGAAFGRLKLLEEARNNGKKRL